MADLNVTQKPTILSQWRSFVPQLVGGAVFLAVFYGLVHFLIAQLNQTNNDFAHFWGTGKVALQGGNPYDWATTNQFFQEIGRTRVSPALRYPVFILPFFMFLGLWGRLEAETIWLMLSLVLFLVSLNLSIQIFEPKRRDHRWYFYIGCALFVPNPIFIHNVLNGQLTFVFTAIIAIFAYACQRGKYQLAAYILLCGLLKPTAVLIFVPLAGLWLLYRGYWREVGRAALVGVGLVVGSLLFWPNWVGGMLESNRRIATEVLEIPSNLYGLSLGMVAFAENDFLAWSLSLLLAGLLVGISLWAWLRWPEVRTNGALIAVWLAPFSLAFSLYNHNYDYLMMLPLAIFVIFCIWHLRGLVKWLVAFDLFMIVLVMPWLLNTQALLIGISALFGVSLMVLAALAYSVVRKSTDVVIAA